VPRVSLGAPKPSAAWLQTPAAVWQGWTWDRAGRATEPALSVLPLFRYIPVGRLMTGPVRPLPSGTPFDSDGLRAASRGRANADARVCRRGIAMNLRIPPGPGGTRKEAAGSRFINRCSRMRGKFASRKGFRVSGPRLFDSRRLHQFLLCFNPRCNTPPRKRADPLVG
jgi:hypothetical protein